MFSLQNLKTRTIPIALAAMAVAAFGVAVPSASAESNDALVTRQQVCYQDPGKGKVCQTIWVKTPGLILPQLPQK